MSDVLASVLKSEPDWRALPESTPASLRWLLARCLPRDPRQRLRDVGEARLALAGGVPPGPGTTTTTTSPGTARGRGPASFWLSLVLVATGSADLTAWLQGRRCASAPRPVTRLSIPLPPGQVLTGNGGPALSHDGRTIAYPARDASGTSRLYLRDLDRLEPRVVPESEGAQQPFFSPDGSRVGFFARGKPMTAAVAGGAPTPIADSSAQPIGGTWGEDDAIVFAPALGSGLLRVPASIWAPTQLTRPDDGPRGYARGRPGFLPGGRSLVYTVCGAASGRPRAAVTRDRRVDSRHGGDLVLPLRRVRPPAAVGSPRNPRRGLRSRDRASSARGRS